MVKNLHAKTGDIDSVPELEDPLEEEMTTHSSILTGIIVMDREAWQATVCGVTKDLDRTW